ncbi:hypothetical protein INR49_015598 [Caranx melampygus]|nr:hypothetical protein INR49_015598 [Caranx melampygus]
MSFPEVLTIIGGFIAIFHLLRLAWRCWCGFREFVLSELWRVDLRRYGRWAVVTGATSGIGKAYATELAQRGLDVVLISRSNDKLQMVAKEIEDRYRRKTHTIQADFTDGHSIYPAIAKELQGLEIGVLVNNVGMTYSDNFAYFLEVPDAEQKITQLINCNMLSVPQIFVAYLSQCLHAEYKSKGITVQCVAPFMVSTNMTKNMQVNCFVKSASGFVYEALNTVGHSIYTSGCLSHALQNVALTILMPDWLRMSTFLITKLRRRAHEDKQKLREKEE